MTGPELRAMLTGVVRGALPDEWTCYAWPPAAPPSWPAAILSAGDPYREPDTYCSDRYRLGVDLLNPTSQGEPGFDAVDLAAPFVVDAITAEQGFGYEATRTVARNVGGIDAYGLTIGLAINGVTP